MLNSAHIAFTAQVAHIAVIEQPIHVVQIDEEDLYSAVGRQPHAAEPDEQEDAAEEEDALNADTFGESALGNALSNNGAGPARTAWTSAGASVALVAGSNRSVMLSTGLYP